MSRMRAPETAELRAPRSARPARARPPAALPDRPSRLRVLLRRQRRVLLRPLLLLAAIGVVALLVAGLVQGLRDGGAFQTQFGQVAAELGLRVRSIVVEGRQKTPERVLRAALGVGAGDPILNLSLTRARARIEAIQWVQHATVERRLPGTVLVRLTERRPFAVWQHQGRFALIDRDGDIVADSDVATFAGQVPLVVGAGAPQAAAALIDGLQAQPALLARVAAAVRVGERRWNLRLRNGIDVLLPEAAVPQVLARLAELQATHGLLDRPLQSVDLRLPDRLVLRPLPDRGGIDRGSIGRGSVGKPGTDPASDPAAAERKPT